MKKLLIFSLFVCSIAQLNGMDPNKLDNTEESSMQLDAGHYEESLLKKIHSLRKQRNRFKKENSKLKQSIQSKNKKIKQLIKENKQKLAKIKTSRECKEDSGVNQNFEFRNGILYMGGSGRYTENNRHTSGAGVYEE